MSRPRSRGAADARPFLTGQLLSAQDLETEQQYLIGMRKLHNRALHGWGVVSGLDVTTGSDDTVVLSPGLALDGVDRTSGQAVVRPGRRRWVPDVPGLLRIIDELRERVSALEARLAEPTGQGTV